MNSTNLIKGGLSAIFTALTIYFGNLAIPFVILTICMLTDWISGMWSACMRCEFSSEKGRKGILKKVGFGFLVAVSAVIDWVISSIGQSFGVSLPGALCLCLLVTIWLILNECISILENINKAGVPLPKWLTAVVKRLKIAADNAGNQMANDEEDEKNESAENGAASE